MKVWYACGATLMAAFAGFFGGTQISLHPLNKDLRVMAFALLALSLMMMGIFLGAGVTLGQ